MMPVLEGVTGVALALFATQNARVSALAHVGVVRFLNAALGAAGLWLVLSAVLPVVIQTRVELVSAEVGRLVIRITGQKIRDCEHTATEAYVVSNGSLRAATLTPMDASGDGPRSMTGMIDSGVWQLAYAPGLEVEGLEFRSVHRCGFWQEVTTRQGPFLLAGLPRRPSEFQAPSEKREPEPAPVPIPQTPVLAPPPVYTARGFASTEMR